LSRKGRKGEEDQKIGRGCTNGISALAKKEEVADATNKGGAPASKRIFRSGLQNRKRVTERTNRFPESPSHAKKITTGGKTQQGRAHEGKHLSRKQMNSPRNTLWANRKGGKFSCSGVKCYQGNESLQLNGRESSTHGSVSGPAIGKLERGGSPENSTGSGRPEGSRKENSSAP